MTTHILADVQRITLNASCMTISGERTEQLDIFCCVTGFTSDFLSFIDVELIRFFHGAIHFTYLITYLLIYSLRLLVLSSNVRIIFVEDAGTGCRVEPQQTLAAQQVHAEAGAVLLVHRRVSKTQLSVVPQKQDRVSQRDGVVEVPLSFTLGCRINLTYVAVL